MKKKFLIGRFRLHRITWLAIIGIIIVITSYIALMLVDAPKSSILTRTEEDRRVFSIGTLEDIGKNFTVRQFEFDFTLKSKTDAIGSSEVWIQNGDSPLNGTLIFLLPCDAIPYPTLDTFFLNVSYRPYGNIVYMPIIMNANQFDYFTVFFNWDSFSKEIGFDKYAFNVEGRAYHYLMDNEGIPFHPLLQTDSAGNLYNMPIGVGVMLGNDYALSESCPSITQKFAGSNMWNLQKKTNTFQISGTYENQISRSNYIMLMQIFPFIASGIIISLLVKLLYDDVKGKRKSNLNWIESDY
jgi:hypothetical protein